LWIYLFFNYVQKIILNGDGLLVYKITKYISCYILDSERKNKCIGFVMKMCGVLEMFSILGVVSGNKSDK